MQHPFLNFGIEMFILRPQSSHQQKKHATEATLSIVEYTQTQTSQPDPFTKTISSWSLVGVHPASTSHGPFPRWSEGLRVHPVGTPARIHDSHCSQGAAIYDGDGNIAQGYCNMWRQIEIGLRI